MNLLIYEHVSGGGYAHKNISASILSEGYGMLRSLISDLKTAGHQVTTLMDSRLDSFNPPVEADETVSVSSSKELEEKLRKLSGAADAVYVVAPESGRVLEKLVKLVESSGGTSLNCHVDAIKLAADKMKTCETLGSRGVKVPETVLLDIHEKTGNIRQLIRDWGYPVVFKPLTGVGCSGSSLVKNKDDIASAVKKVTLDSLSDNFIVQKFVEGTDASVSVYSTGDKALAVSLNKQFVTLGTPDEESGYYGGTVPFNHRFEREALKTAQWTVESIRGLKGYVGVDMVLAEEEPVVMEVNPRLTTSYIGLRKVTGFNPAQAIVDAAFGGKLPENSQPRGYAFFSKVKVPPNPQIITETYQLKEIVSPPFPVSGNESAYALLAASSTSPNGAEETFYKAQKRLLALYGGDD